MSNLWSWGPGMARPSSAGYPQEVFSQVPVLFEPFDTFTGAAAGGQIVGTAPNVSVDAADKLEGAGSVLVSGGATSGTTTIGWDRTPASGNLDPAGLGIMAFAYKQPNGIQQNTSIQIQLFRSGNSIQFTGGSQAVAYPCLDWQWQQFDPAIQGGYASFISLGPGILRRRALVSGSGPTRDVKWDAFYQNVKRGPSVVTINFDDGYTSQRDVAAPLCLARNLPFTLHLEYALLTGNGSGANQRLTVADVTAMKALYGENMQICSQGDGVNFTDTNTYANAAAVITRLNQIKAAFTTNGWVQGNNLKCVSYPGGQTNAAIIAALKADGGFNCARWVGSDNYFGLFGNHDRKWCYPSWGTSSGGVLATLTAGLDLAISQGADFNLHIHDVSSSAIGISEAVLTGFLNAVAVHRNYGRCLVMNDPEWHDYRAGFSRPA